jgi:phospholipid/cholesterol/gamma-HCH transport system substrate-binding protein
MDRPGQFRPTLLSFTLFVAVALGWLVFLLGKGHSLPSIGGDKPYDVQVQVPTSSALTTNSRVTMAGVQVGRVTGVKRGELGAIVDLTLTDKSVYPLPQDSHVQLRQHTPIGENYVSITAGDAKQTLPSGGSLPLDQADEYVDVDQILSTLRGKTKSDARETLQSLGGALDGRGDDLNRLTTAVNDFAPAGGRIVQILYADRRQVADLVVQLGDLAAAIGQRGDAIDTIASRGMVALGALRDRDDALAAGLDRLPGTLTAVKSIVTTIGTVSDKAVPVARNLTQAIADVTPAVRDLAPGSTAGRSILTALGGASPGLQATLEAATRTSQQLPAVFPKLKTTLCNAHPMMRYSSPYFPADLGIITGLGSASNSYDATGHLIRLTLVLGDNSLSGQGDAFEAAESQLLHDGIIGSSGTYLNYQPYPKPGDLGTTVATSSQPIGPEAQKAAGYTYPRIKADC